MFRNLGEARPQTSTSTSQSIITALDMSQHKWDKKRFRLRDIQVCIPAATGKASILTQKEWLGTVHNSLPANITPGVNVDDEPEEKRMIGDFDGSANALWTLYGKEAKSHDEARIHTLKDDMDGVLIFVRSYFLQRL
jgi:hypothetical protein